MKSISLTFLITLLCVPLLSQPKKCIVTDFEHWSLNEKESALYGEYFVTGWQDSVKQIIRNELANRYAIEEIQFLTDSITHKSNERDLDTWNMEDFKKSPSELYVGISSYINMFNGMSVLVKVVNDQGKTIYRKKSKVLLETNFNEEGIDNDLAINADGFRACYMALLANSFRDGKKRLPGKEVSRGKDQNYQEFLVKADQFNYPSEVFDGYGFVFEGIGPLGELWMGVSEDATEYFNPVWKLAARARQKGKFLLSNNYLGKWLVEFELWSTSVLAEDIFLDEEKSQGLILLDGEPFAQIAFKQTGISVQLPSEEEFHVTRFSHLTEVRRNNEIIFVIQPMIDSLGSKVGYKVFTNNVADMDAVAAAANLYFIDRILAGDAYVTE